MNESKVQKPDYGNWVSMKLIWIPGGYCYWTQLIIQKALSDGSNCPRPSRKWPCVSSESQGAPASFPAFH
jgi:hypothetical protein